MTQDSGMRPPQGGVQASRLTLFANFWQQKVLNILAYPLTLTLRKALASNYLEIIKSIMEL
jgi:hypothetical protein